MDRNFNNLQNNKYFNSKRDDQVECKSQPFYLSQPKSYELPSNSQEHFNKQFFNSAKKNVEQNYLNNNNIPLSNPVKAESTKKEQKEWEGDFFDVIINEICIPIPNFVQFSIIKQLFSVVEEVQKQMNSYLNSEQLKNQTLNMIHKDFIKKNEKMIEKYRLNDQKKEVEDEERKNNFDQQQKKKQPAKMKIEYHRRGHSGVALSEHMDKENEEYNQRYRQAENDTRSTVSYRSNKPHSSEQNQGLIQIYKIINKQNLKTYANDLQEFLDKKIKENQQNCYKIYSKINDQIRLKLEKQSVKNKKPQNKNPHLYNQQDYQIETNQMQSILKSINKFGVDKCQVQQKINQALKTETISINFKENKVLKTITYSILYRFICQQELTQAQKFIYKTLGYINPTSQGYESENFLLRQIFLHFLCILIIEIDYQPQAVSFLNELFAFEFISSLIFDYFFLSASKIMKVNNPIINLKEKIEVLANGYNLDLYLIDRNHNTQKYVFKRPNDSESNLIFVYFEQSLNQDSVQAVYFVKNPNDQLLALL
ncbi:hypothetical protein ABPG72_013738 [Tetrahymena utriculariae]